MMANYRADEMYAELKKDQASGRALREEIEDAKESHPSSQLGEGFMTRSTALSTRLAMLSDPITSRSFPRPTHPSYPDQPQFTESITTLLSSELRTAVRSSRTALANAQQYQKSCEAVGRVEGSREEMSVLIARFDALEERLLKGTQAADGDGSPPNVDTEDCLDQLRHGAYLALLPSVNSDLDSCNSSANKTLQDCRIALLELQRVTLDGTFRTETDQQSEKLEATKLRLAQTRQDVERRAALVRDSRRIWEAIRDTLASVQRTRDQVLQIADRQRWKAERGRDGAPLTPDSPSIDLPTSDLSPSATLEWVDNLQKGLTQSVSSPLQTLRSSLGAKLANHISSASDNLNTRVDLLKVLLRFWGDVRRQADVMTGVRDETHDFEQRVEDLRTQLLESRRKVLELPDGTSVSTTLEPSYREDIDKLRQSIERFTDSLASRVPLIANTRPDSRNHTRPPTSQSALEMLPFSPSALDHAVRTDVNAFSMSLAGGVDSLSRNLDHLQLAILAKGVDGDIKTVVTDAQRLEKHLESFTESMKQAVTVKELAIVSAIAGEIKDGMDMLSSEHRKLSTGPLLALKKGLAVLESHPSTHDLAVYDSIMVTRRRSAESTISRIESLTQKLDVLARSITQTLEGIGLAQQVEQLTGMLWDAISLMSSHITALERKVDNIDLDSLDASTLLALSQSTLDQTVLKDQAAIAEAAQAVRERRMSLDNSASSHDDTLHPLIHPRIVIAVEAESKVKSVEPRAASLKEKITLRIQTISNISALRGNVEQLSLKLVETSLLCNSFINRLDSAPLVGSPNSDEDLPLLLHDVIALQESSSRSSIQSLASLRVSLTELHQHAGARDSAVQPLLEGCVSLIDKVASEVSELESRVSFIRTQVSDRIELMKRRQDLDQKAAKASAVLAEVESEVKTIEDALETILQTLPMHAGSLTSPVGNQLASLRKRLGEFSSGPGMVGASLLQALRTSVHGLKSVSLVADNTVYDQVIAPRTQKLEDLEAGWKSFSQSLSSASARIIEAERAEAERLATETARREAAEREALRLAAEEKARLEAEERAVLQAEKARIAAEADALKRAQEEARKAADEKARLDAEEAEKRRMAEQARQEEEARRKAQWEAEEVARRLSVEKARFEEDKERARRDAEDRSRREREEAERVRMREEEELCLAEAKLAASKSSKFGRLTTGRLLISLSAIRSGCLRAQVGTFA